MNVFAPMDNSVKTLSLLRRGRVHGVVMVLQTKASQVRWQWSINSRATSVLPATVLQMNNEANSLIYEIDHHNSCPSVHANRIGNVQMSGPLAAIFHFPPHFYSICSSQPLRFNVCEDLCVLHSFLYLANQGDLPRIGADNQGVHEGGDSRWP